jgi:hypothetical protein
MGSSTSLSARKRSRTAANKARKAAEVDTLTSIPEVPEPADIETQPGSGERADPNFDSCVDVSTDDEPVSVKAPASKRRRGKSEQPGVEEGESFTGSSLLTVWRSAHTSQTS